MQDLQERLGEKEQLVGEIKLVEDGLLNASSPNYEAKTKDRQKQSSNL